MRRRSRVTVVAATTLAAGAVLYTFSRGRRATSAFPRAAELDSTLALLNEGYTFISSRCQRFQTDIFEARLMGQQLFCMTGAEAARAFYVPGRFTRRRAMPVTAMMLLQDSRSVQQLDGDAHHDRKRLFMSLAMDGDRVQELVALSRHEWERRFAVWQRQGGIVVHEEAQRVLCAAVCAWAGLPLAEGDVRERAREFGAMIDGAGGIGLRHLRGHLLRARTEQWARDVISRIRTGGLEGGPERAAHAIAWHRDERGRLLDLTTAAVELINVLRPTIAVARYITFAVLALHQHPEWLTSLRSSGAHLEWFVQEVRRFYPFVPAVGGRVISEFEWNGHQFSKGTWVLLDLYGTNHDARLWPDPDTFRPERFASQHPDAFNLIPQGGGGHVDGHRCPGEDVTIALVKTAVRHFAAMAFDVPSQDLSIDLARMPAIPASRLVITNVRRG